MNPVIAHIFSPQKGILAADERPSSIFKRFKKEGIPETEEMSFAYRSLLFTTPSIEQYISGVILSEDIFLNHRIDGGFSRDFLAKKGISVGVKVDGGLVPYTEKEPHLSLTKGFEDLKERCTKYRELGAQFTKWRSVVPVHGATPTFLKALAQDMAQYASIAQQAGLVPIVEPEVLIEGEHSIDDAAKTIQTVLTHIIEALQEHSVDTQACILKTSFACNVNEHTNEQEVASATIQALMPAKVFGGVVFLSGGLHTKEAIAYLKEVTATSTLSTPITFSYGRALQNDALTTWKGSDQHIKEAHHIFMETLQKTTQAVL